ncbi:long-chain fatty acid--CoA ligase [Roseococcus sp. SYP-B2431]|uniref:class I adenylate-forming enzyme family protein n=1 Tax=Roseococcus sp. SYP-B2431 TaxID=2496640 RepID=UPI00103E6AC9|nr:AMP-binding protein [Roseococcus sp. SYP-B2431]TCH97990.1 long-chain fatty acid--CoA ligase [Roseococcus sp. SYP-B2431]
MTFDLNALAPVIAAEEVALRRAGAERGDRIGWIGLNDPSMIALLFACERLGLTLVPLNWRLAADELQWIAEDAGLRLVRFGPDSGAVPPRPAPDEARCDALLIGYTSGTTGRPKGAMLSAEALRANAENAAQVFGFTPEDHVLTVLPLFHVGGLNIQTVPALLAGARVTLLPKFDPDGFFDAMASLRPTLTLLVPAVMAALVNHPRWPAEDLSSLRAIGAGSSEVPLALIQAFHDRGIPVQQVYGMTETSPIAIAQTRSEALAAPGSIGRAAPLCEARIGAAGEIEIRGPNVMSGYWRRPEETAEALRDGWFRTGDVGHQDAEGRFWFTDRLKRVIISGGENIYPAELERVLHELPGLRECAVIGRADPRWGEVPVAVVVATPEFDEARMAAHFERRLARFKHPRGVIRVDALPRTALGKVQVEKLRGLMEGG